MGVTVSNLMFSFGNVEPFFCELALYDVDTKKKQSESFHFHLNTQPILDMIKQRAIDAAAAAAAAASAGSGRDRSSSGASRPSVAVAVGTGSPATEHKEIPGSTGLKIDSSESRHAIFQLAGKRKSIYLVLLVYKIFQGDIKAVYDAYSKPKDKLTEKDRIAILDKIKKSCETNCMLCHAPCPLPCCCDDGIDQCV